MNRSKQTITLRATGLWLLTTAAAAALALPLLHTVRGGTPGATADATTRFSDLLAQACAVALVGCLAWAWLITTVVLAEAVTTPVGPARPRRRGLPAAYRRLILSACGVALAAGSAAPALATPGPVPVPAVTHAAAATGAPATPSVAGPAPMRAPLRLPEQAARPITVAPGDSLWRIAEDRLPPGAPVGTIDHTWRRLYEANAAVIGADPDHIEPGQRLLPPKAW